eukprot:scaffold6355_cov99-Skeletonema_dohrnii-CCMP3373.AAC.1
MTTGPRRTRTSNILLKSIFLVISHSNRSDFGEVGLLRLGRFDACPPDSTVYTCPFSLAAAALTYAVLLTNVSTTKHSSKLIVDASARRCFRYLIGWARGGRSKVEYLKS